MVAMIFSPTVHGQQIDLVVKAFQNDANNNINKQNKDKIKLMAS